MPWSNFNILAIFIRRCQLTRIKPEPSLKDKARIPCTFPEEDEGTLAKYDPMA